VNFLQLCQDLVIELGLAGGTGPATVLNQRGELANVVRWIRNSDLWVSNQWKTWKFLKVEYSGVIQAGSREPTAPNNPTGVRVRKWDRDSIVINAGSLSAKPLMFEEWSTFRKLRQIGSAGLTVDEPAIITVKEIGTDPKLWIYPTANATYPISGEFWRRPIAMTQDTDVPAMPEEYHRLIVTTAAIMYGNREDAPEIIAGMEAEHATILKQLQDDQLEGFEPNSDSSQDILLEGAIPGEEWSG
jgi:hypothetical protein